jgi:hypothetical protein
MILFGFLLLLLLLLLSLLLFIYLFLSSEAPIISQLSLIPNKEIQ